MGDVRGCAGSSLPGGYMCHLLKGRRGGGRGGGGPPKRRGRTDEGTSKGQTKLCELMSKVSKSPAGEVTWKLLRPTFGAQDSVKETSKLLKVGGSCMKQNRAFLDRVEGEDEREDES
eukprot:752801-Hanusia_phi.AAC.3